MKKKTIAAVLFIFFLLILTIVSILVQTGGGGEEKEIFIPKGFNAGQIAGFLDDSGIIRNRHFFLASVYLLGQQNNLKAGAYKLSAGMTNSGIIMKLKKGDIVPAEVIRVTFPEGSSVYKISKILGQKEYLYAEQFYSVNAAMEGYLFPDTYIFDKGSKPDVLAKIMNKRFKEVVLPYWEHNKDKTEYNLHQILTLASIIEKEAQKAEERPIISSVFHNRLDINMALDSCPTIKYALNDPTPKVYLWQLKVKSPYNTYLNRGLPPGPICNPGLESIKAAIYPAKTKYFYFVAKKDGSHIFSRTLEEHNRAKAKIPN